MHPPLFRFLLLAAASFAASTLTATAQEATPPSDPFVKSKPAATATPSPTEALAAPSAPGHPIFVFETYLLSQEDLDALHAESPPATEFYTSVRRLTTDGKATLETVVAVPTKSGQRVASESVDEVLYATEFDPPEAGRPYAFPSAYENRPTGERIELDPVVSEDGKRLDVNLSTEITRFQGFVELKAGNAPAGAGGELQPLFTSRKITTSVTCRPGVPFLLGTQSRPGGTGLPETDRATAMVSVSFITGRMVEVPFDAKPDVRDVANLRSVFRFYSLPRDSARDLLVSTTDAETLLTQMLALPKEAVKLERIMTLHTRPGQRATIEEIAENLYGTQAVPPSSPLVQQAVPEGKNAAGTVISALPPVYASAKEVLPAATNAIEMRPVGWRIELDPVLSPDGSVVDLNLAPEHVENRGNLQGPPLLDRYPQKPVFAAQKITTCVNATIGRQCFLGTFNAPHDTGVNGRKDDGRVWFAFVKVTLE